MERDFLHGLADTVVRDVNLRDINVCVERTMGKLRNNAHVHNQATILLRAEIRECIDRRLILASDAFTCLPKPLRGTELRATAKELGIVQRSERVHIAADVLRLECEVAQARTQSNTHTDVGQTTQPADILATNKKKKTQRRVQACRFNMQERNFLQTVMDAPMAKVQVKDVALCVQFAMHVIHKDKIVHAQASTVLRKEVLDRLLTQGTRVLRQMMLRHEA